MKFAAIWTGRLVTSQKALVFFAHGMFVFVLSGSRMNLLAVVQYATFWILALSLSRNTEPKTVAFGPQSFYFCIIRVLIICYPEYVVILTCLFFLTIRRLMNRGVYGKSVWVPSMTHRSTDLPFSIQSHKFKTKPQSIN